MWKRMNAVCTGAHGSRINAGEAVARYGAGRAAWTSAARRPPPRSPPARAFVRSSARRPSEDPRHEVPADPPAVLLVLDVGAQHPLLHERAQDERGVPEQENEDIPGCRI